MLEETFADERVVLLSKDFTCIYVDADLEPTICQEFGVEGFPTVQFISARGVLLQRIQGKKEAGWMVDQMQVCLRMFMLSFRDSSGDQPIPAILQ